jgi:NAD+ synthase (glutamine-hydrolysing)
MTAVLLDHRRVAEGCEAILAAAGAAPEAGGQCGQSVTIASRFAGTPPPCNILMAQINTVVGDFAGNAQRVLDTVRAAVAERRAPVVVFPELTLSGYPPEDLLLRPSIGGRVAAALELLKAQLPPRPGSSSATPWPAMATCTTRRVCSTTDAHRRVLQARAAELPGLRREALLQCRRRALRRRHRRRPRRFEYLRGHLGGTAGGRAAQAGAKVLLNLNASPYHRGKQDERVELVCRRAVEQRAGDCLRQSGRWPG